MADDGDTEDFGQQPLTAGFYQIADHHAFRQMASGASSAVVGHTLEVTKEGWSFAIKLVGDEKGNPLPRMSSNEGHFMGAAQMKSIQELGLTPAKPPKNTVMGGHPKTM